MIKLSNIVVVSSVFLLVSCGEGTAEGVLTSSKVKDTPEVREMLSEFAQQEHRFEFKGCDLLYNGSKFNLKTSIDELEGIVGNYNMSDTAYGKKTIYYWLNELVNVYEYDESKELSSFTVYFSSIEPSEKPLVVLIEGVPITNRLKMHEFIENSNYSFSDFSIDDDGYRLDFSECSNALSYYFFSDVKYSYIGDGHARLRDKPILTETNVVESVGIYKYDE